MHNSFDTEVEIVQSGRVQLFEHFTKNQPMWSGEGDRDETIWIEFEKPFHEPPEVLVSPALVDARTESNLRYDLSVSNIQTHGFEIVFKTWLDSQFARVAASWIAIGKSMREEYGVDLYPDNQT